MIRIDKFLSLKNICSRKDSLSFIKRNDVFVNNEVITKKNHPINEGDTITINSTTYTYNEHVYFIMNKPKGYICSNIDELYPSVLNLINHIDYQNDLFTVGRLDCDTTGVLLITNDGKFSNSLLKPSKNEDKTYRVTLEQPITDEDIKVLESNIKLSDFTTKGAVVEKTNDTTINLTISEGKHHQVKRMIHHINNEVLELHRVSFCGYVIDFDDSITYKKLDIKI